MTSIPLHRELELQTGDIILFQGTSWLSRLLEFVGRSKYSHVGLILKNPRFLNESLEDGLYLWDASWGDQPDAEDHQFKFGVQIHKLDDVLADCKPGTVFVRKNNAIRNESVYETLRRVHETVHDKPYDLNIIDWIAARIQMTIHIPFVWKHTSRFWCSALVAYIYHELGWISDVNWSLIAPREFSSVECTGQLLFTSVISDETLLA